MIATINLNFKKTLRDKSIQIFKNMYNITLNT